MLYKEAINMAEKTTKETIYQIGMMLNEKTKISSISKNDIEIFRKFLYKSIEMTGINSSQTMQASNILNELINIQMKKV